MRAKSLYVLILAIVLLPSCSMFNISYRHQQQYFPKQLAKFYLGMPFHNFQKIKNNQEMIIFDDFDFRTEYTESFSEGEIEEITYYFTKGESEILFEFIIKYTPDFDIHNFSFQKYGKHNAGDEWIFDSKSGFDMMIWIFETKLVIAGKIPGSGWE